MHMICMGGQLAARAGTKPGNYGVKAQRVEIIDRFRARERIFRGLLGLKRRSGSKEGVRRERGGGERENSYWRHREPHWTPSEGSTKPLCIEMTVLWGISYFIFKPPILRVFTGSNWVYLLDWASRMLATALSVRFIILAAFCWFQSWGKWPTL